MDRSSVGIRAACVCPLILVAGLTAAPAAILAQVAGGEITGAVTDQAGAAVPGATVTVSSGANGQQRVVLTTADGIYAAPGLAPASPIEIQRWAPDLLQVALNSPVPTP